LSHTARRQAELPSSHSRTCGIAALRLRLQLASFHQSWPRQSWRRRRSMSCGCTFAHSFTGLTNSPRRNAPSPPPPADAGAEALTPELLRRLPKAHLHCHLDGYVRPQTLVELAKELGVTHTKAGVELPPTADGAKSLIEVPCVIRTANPCALLSTPQSR